MSVRFNTIEIQNPQQGNVLAVTKSQRILRPLGGGTHVWNLDATLYRLELPFRGLRDAEKSALEVFFETTVEGLYQEFLFTDHHEGRWLAFFTAGRLEFRCADDAVASPGTFESGGVTYPTTTREAPVWDVDVELEVVPLQLLFDGTMEDTAHRWTSITTSGGGAHAYHVDAAYSGSFGSRDQLPGVAGATSYGRKTTAALRVYSSEFWLNIAALTMADGNSFLFFSQGAAAVRLTRSGSEYRVGPTATYVVIDKATWARVENFVRKESRAGARDGQRLLLVNGQVAYAITGQTGGDWLTYPTYGDGGPLSEVDVGTSGSLYIDDVSFWGAP